MKQREKSICFAYFGDGKFLGWYADSFGSIRPQSPKIYRYSSEQLETIGHNFTNKISELNEKSTIAKNDSGLSLIDNGLNEDKDILLQYKNIELRIVECPEYDGPNPDFNEDAWEKLMAERDKQMKEAGIFDIPGPSLERFEAVEKFNEENPKPKCNNWIYADYKKIKEWASKEPTEFIGEIGNFIQLEDGTLVPFEDIASEKLSSLKDKTKSKITSKEIDDTIQSLRNEWER